MKHARICVICGKEYSYCPNCTEYAELPRWMFLFDKENCKDIWEVINKYRSGEFTAAQAKAELQKLDMSYKDSITPDFKAFLDKICEETKPVKIQKENHKEDRFNKKPNNSEH